MPKRWLTIEHCTQEAEAGCLAAGTQPGPASPPATLRGTGRLGEYKEFNFRKE